VGLLRPSVDSQIGDEPKISNRAKQYAMTFRPSTAVAIGVAIVACVSAIAQATDQANLDSPSQGRLIAEAVMRPRIVERVLGEVGDQCAKRIPSLEALAAESTKVWHNRNGKYLIASAKYREDLRAMIESRPDSEQTRALRQLIGPEVDVVVTKVSNQIMARFKTDFEQKPADTEVNCRTYLEGAENGKFDMKEQATDVARFLDQVAAGQPTWPKQQ